MILYHGSYLSVKKPDILHSRTNVDFGPGFYTTPLREQAEKWCERFQRRGRDAILSIYHFDEAAFDHCNVLKFDSYSEQWLDYILACRTQQDKSNFDIVIGGVANDKVFNTVELYFDHLIDKSEAIRRLKFEQPNLQICFRSQHILDEYLHFEGSEHL